MNIQSLALARLSLIFIGLFSIADMSVAAEQGWTIDGRYGHNRSYPPTGYVSHELPHAALEVPHQGTSYYFHEGSWYRHERFGFSVVAPPIGIFVPILPPFYSTVWFGGIPYYYANDTYYVHDPVKDGYVVTTPPEGVTPNSQDVNDELFAYPKNGQSKEQQATDRYECHRWAADQTGFDVTRPLGGVSPVQVESKKSAYRRAEIACLEARGYTVK